VLSQEESGSISNVYATAFFPLEWFVEELCEPVRSFASRHQPFRQFALHHVFFDLPENSLWNLGIS
jgi:hypothetical protein